MTRPFSELELEAYLDESLAPQDTLAIETTLRDEPSLSHHLTQRLAAINQRRNAGVHTVGEIWRRHRLSCPTRENLGSYLLGALPDEQLDFVRFHLNTVGCRICLANLEDLRQHQGHEQAAAVGRRKKIFKTSAGFLRGNGQS